MKLWAEIARQIAPTSRVVSASAVGGGCINQTYRLRLNEGQCYFVKLNHVDRLPMLVAERAALETITTTQTLRVPRPLVHGVAGESAFLVLEWLELRSRGNARQLGEGLAALHCVTAPAYGFSQDNFVGSTSQPNGWLNDWITFWRTRRLGFQLDLATRNGYRFGSMGERLLAELPAFFQGYTTRPALLHGDLWSGNYGYLPDGAPVIFDPAAYYGDREADLAMTELFGGFSPDFYAAYRANLPLDAGYPVRRELYNLYHILNHANLFGAGYVRQAEGLMRRLLAELG